jgi:hypothetical protein
LEIDFQQSRTAELQLRENGCARGAISVTTETGVLQQFSLSDEARKTILVDEAVMLPLDLARPRMAGSDTGGDPHFGVSTANRLHNRALTDPGRPGKDCQPTHCHHRHPD